MTSNRNKIIIVALVVVIVLLSIQVIFDSKFDDFQNMVKWQKEYNLANPYASDE